MLSLRDLTEFDPKKKDLAWINKMVTYIRATWVPLVDKTKVAKNLSVLFGVQSMEEVRAMFAKPENAGLKFIPMAMLEKMRNIFTQEIREGGIQIHVKATDPTAFNQKERDRELLSNRRIIETIISAEQKSIGGPEYRMTDDKDESGEPIFNGNIKDFDEMGLDENSSEDIGYFMAYWHRLNHEIKAEEPINAYFKLSEVEEMLPLLVDDCMAKKAIAYRSYVSDTNGAIEHKYMRPEDTYWIPGKRKDGKDAGAKGNESEVTVGEFLRMVGADFNEEQDLPLLLQAVNMNTLGNMPNMWYTGVSEDGCMKCGTEKHPIEFSTLVNTMVKVGYVEFKSNDGTAFRVTKKNYHGNPSIRPLAMDKKVWENAIYKKDVYYNEVVYKAYYLATSTTEQRLFKAGKLNWQQVEGADDEYACYSLSTYVEIGKTFVEIAEPFVTIWMKAFAKMEFELNRSKPAGRAYFYDSLVAIAAQMFPKETSKYGAIMQVLKFFTESPNEIYTVPEINGSPVGGGGQSSYALENGLSKTFPEFRNVMDWAEAMIDRMIGISPQRKAYAPQPREVASLQEGSTDYSERATSYMPRMIENTLVTMATTTLSLFQDIIMFKDKSTLAYKHLLRMLGDQTMEDLKTLGKVSLHRYSLFVEWFNLAREREEIKTITYRAMDSKEISPEQAMLVNSIRSPKRAVEMLAREKKRTEIRNAKQLQAQNEAALALSDKKHKERMEEIDLQGKYTVQARDIGGRYLMESRKVEGLTAIEKQQMKVDADTEKIGLKTEAEIERIAAEQELNQQAAAPMGE